jgi:hypothetical protein
MAVLEPYSGISTVGLFRVGGSAKRCRQLRSLLDRGGVGGPLFAETSPHDVACLLKEYFRDLPQPLLIKEHYQAYISAISE